MLMAMVEPRETCATTTSPPRSGQVAAKGLQALRAPAVATAFFVLTLAPPVLAEHDTGDAVRQSPAADAASGGPQATSAVVVENADGEDPAALARRVLDHVDDLFRGDSSYGHARMSVVTSHWQRTLELEFWSRGRDDSLIRILAPAKEKGTGTLRVGNDLWNYLPKVKRVIKLPSSMMSAAWMGSHFTNDDLVKDSRMADDYDVHTSFEGARDGADVLEITAVPKPEAAVVWGRVVVEVESQGWLPRRIRYYDEEEVLARTMTYHDVAELGGRRLPTRMVMQPAEEPEESTVVEWLDIRFDPPLPEDLFSLRTLQR
jgi:hypothetical protein